MPSENKTYRQPSDALRRIEDFASDAGMLVRGFDEIKSERVCSRRGMSISVRIWAPYPDLQRAQPVSGIAPTKSESPGPSEFSAAANI